MPVKMEVVKTLVGRRLPDDQLMAVGDFADLVSCDFTRAGYLLTIRHPALPLERVVCAEPLLTGFGRR